jgi:hypothetical protein
MLPEPPSPLPGCRKLGRPVISSVSNTQPVQSERCRCDYLLIGICETCFYNLNLGVHRGNELFKGTLRFSNLLSAPVRNKSEIQGLCESGGYSGEQCGTQVLNNNATIAADSFGNTFQKMLDLEEPNHYAAAGPGDSGGPVYMFNWNDGTVKAAGIISSGDIANAPAPCPTGGVQGTRQCSYHIYAGQVAVFDAAYGYAVMTQ